MMKGGGKFEVQVGLSFVGPSTHCFVFEHLADHSQVLQPGLHKDDC